MQNYYDPNQPRDKIGRWTKAMNSISGSSLTQKEKDRLINDIQEESIAFAPFRELNVNSPEEDEAIRNSPEYLEYMKDAERLAGALGVTITGKLDTLGGYVDSDTKRPVVEVSNIISVSGSEKNIELMAAMLGVAAPELQDSVLVSHYKENGSSTEYKIETGSFKNGIAALDHLKNNNLEYFSIDKNNGDLIILDIDNENTKNILTFVKTLKEKNLYQNLKFSHAEAKFIGKAEYGPIIERSGVSARTENGGSFNTFIEEAARKYAAIKEEKIKHNRIE